MGVVLQFKARQKAEQPRKEPGRPLGAFDTATLILAYGRLMSGWSDKTSDTLMKDSIEKELERRNVSTDGFSGHFVTAG